MITASLATYPPRRAFLQGVVDALAPQVDRLNLVLNQYDAVPEELVLPANVYAMIPDQDYKDVGKFYPDVTGATYVLFVDDDVIYPVDFIARTVASYEALGLPHAVAGYHCSTYRRPPLALSVKAIKAQLRFWLSPRHIARFRRVNHFEETSTTPVYVDQVATNAAITRGADVPPLSYMQGSQKFVDVRLAKWCHANGVPMVSLPRAAGWLGLQTVEESIIMGFTSRHHQHVADEIRTYAFKSPKVGTSVGPGA